MRVFVPSAETGGGAEGSPVRMDDFAALRPAAPSIGGYRVMRARRVGRDPERPRPAARQPGKRMRAPGFFSALLAGGLALAILVGPASCPCELNFAAQAGAASRFAYTKTDAIDPSVPELPIAELIERDVTSGASPISTSAIQPLGDAPADVGRSLPSRFTQLTRLTRLTRLTGLPAKIEVLADTAPQPIKVATAAIGVGELPELRPVVVITAPDASEVIAVEPTTKKRSAQKRGASQRVGKRVAKARGAKQHSEKASTSKKIPRAPRWAAQMFENPWQTRAFSYIQ